MNPVVNDRFNTFWESLRDVSVNYIHPVFILNSIMKIPSSQSRSTLKFV